MVDLDFFKNFNDTYGHMEGDHALRYAAHIFTQMLQPTDIIGRYGGEEFIMFLPLMDANQGYATIENIRQTMAETPFVLEDGNTTQLTASFGLATILPSPTLENAAEKLRTTIALADSALYEAKKAGRNRVCMAPLNNDKREQTPDAFSFS